MGTADLEKEEPAKEDGGRDPRSASKATNDSRDWDAPLLPDAGEARGSREPPSDKDLETPRTAWSKEVPPEVPHEFIKEQGGLLDSLLTGIGVNRLAARASSFSSREDGGRQGSPCMPRTVSGRALGAVDREGSPKSRKEARGASEVLWRGRPMIVWYVGGALLGGFLTLCALSLFGAEGYRHTSLRAPQAGICNSSVGVPGPFASPYWWVNSTQYDTCRAARYPENKPGRHDGRNWCWVITKDTCHSHLKDHKNWADIQQMAQWSGAPKPEESPWSPLVNPELCDVPANGERVLLDTTEWEVAQAWFDSHVGVYVLNLDTDVSRWTTIKGKLERLQIFPKRVSGVDMRVAGTLEKAKEAGYIPSWYDFERVQAKVDAEDPGYGKVKGTLGCASAHFKAQATVMEDGPLMGVVFEDDSDPDQDFKARLWRLVTQELPCDWEVVSLMSRCPVGTCVSEHLARIAPDVNEPAWKCHSGVNWGMHGVLYRTSTLRSVQEKWKKAVFNMDVPRCLDVDVALASISDQVGFYAVPASQGPGFMQELSEGSSRYSINKQLEASEAAAKAAATAAATAAAALPPAPVYQPPPPPWMPQTPPPPPGDGHAWWWPFR